MKDNRDYKKPRKNSFKKAPRGGETQPVEVVTDKFAHIEPVQAQPLEVKVYHNNFDKALRAFRALVQKERILSAYKEKQSYEKPSDKGRRKRNEMKRKRLELENPRPPRESKKPSFKRKPKSDGSPE
jgi:ribosomal protein S21